jgi:hypothetical protein
MVISNVQYKRKQSEIGYKCQTLHENGLKLNAKIRGTQMHVLCVVDYRLWHLNWLAVITITVWTKIFTFSFQCPFSQSHQ